MSNKETIEEAAEKEYPTIHEWYQYDAFIKGAKWQAERMYSEEEVLAMLAVKHNNVSAHEVLEWCKQFKQKQ